MTLRWLVKSDNKIYNHKVDIKFIKDYKQRPNKSTAKTPTRIVLNRKNTLLGIFRKRQQFNEIRTIHAVENCRRRFSAEIERFFEEKERTINNLSSEIIVGRKTFANVLNKYEMDNLIQKIEHIILNDFSKRFDSLVEGNLIKASSDQWIADIFSPVQKYLATKKRTVLITSYMESLSRRTLSDAIESLLANSIISKIVCNVDISTMLLPKLGINSGIETMELNEELHKRISGALYSIKVHLIQEMNHRIADIFYKMHDLQLEPAIELKIHLLEEKIAAEVYQNELLEA